MEWLGAALWLFVMALNVLGAVVILRTPPCPWCRSRYWMRSREYTISDFGMLRTHYKMRIPICLACELREAGP